MRSGSGEPLGVSMAQRSYRPGPKKVYGDKLKDPRWQQKRLRILERDEWMCQACGDQLQMLCVHHLWYDGEPWSVPDEALVTLCDDCHASEPIERSEQEEKLLRALRTAFPISGWIRELAEAVAAGAEHLRDYTEGILPVLKYRELARAADALVAYWRDTAGEIPRIPDVYEHFRDDHYAWIANEWDGEILPLIGSQQDAFALMSIMTARSPETRSVGGTGPYHSA